MLGQKNSSADAWTNYWNAGNSETCFSGNKAFSVEDHWHRYFQTLEKNTRLLDLATGNGAVALIAAKYSVKTALNLDIHAVDQANITPPHHSDDPSFTQIAFLANTQIENTPYEDGYFSAITSQFGFEYSDLPETIKEISRITKPGATVHFLIHAHDGEVHKDSLDRIARVKRVLREKKLPNLALDLGRLNASRAPEPKIEKAVKKFLAKASMTLDSLSDAPPDDAAFYCISYLNNLIINRNRYDPEDLSRCIRDANHDLRAYMIRLNAMVRSSQSEKSIAMISSTFQSVGFAEMSYEPLKAGGEVIGWDFFGQKIF